MSRRILRCGLLSAALLGTTALASAKPPDLPADVKTVATPMAVPATDEPVPAPAPEVNQFGNIVPQPGAVAAPAVEEPEPIFYHLHLADRKTMASCFLFGVHPLLALTPPDRVLYLPMEIRESLEDAVAPQPPPSATPIAPSAGAMVGAAAGTITFRESTTGSLMFGVGVNSDAGLRGSIVVAPRVSVCPFLAQPQTVQVKVEPERTVLDNLKALEECDRLLDSAKEMLHTGRVCEALDFFEKIGRMCPGSRYDEVARALVAEVFKHFPGAAEEAEEGAKHKEEPNLEGYRQFMKWFWPFSQNDSGAESRIRQLLNLSEDGGLIEKDWKPGWWVDQPSHLSYDRIHGGLQVAEEEEEAPLPEAREIEINRHLNMPVTLQFKNVPLRDVLQNLRQAYGLNIAVDEAALAKKGIDASRLITIKLDQISLKSALRLILKNVDLDCIVQDGSIRITTPEIALLVAQLDGTEKETVAGIAPAGIHSLEPGTRVMADGLLKAARLALESGRYADAVDLSRQAFALDPVRMREEPALYSLYLLIEKAATARSVTNNTAPTCPVAGATVRSGIAGEPSLRPSLPGVDPRVVAALEKVQAEAEAVQPRLEIVIEEEQEPREQSRSLEIAEPFVLDAAKWSKCLKDIKTAHQAWDCVSDLVPPGNYVGTLKEIVDFRLGVVLSKAGTKSGKMLSFGLLGWSMKEVPDVADDD